MAGFFRVPWNLVHSSYCWLGRREGRVQGIGVHAGTERPLVTLDPYVVTRLWVPHDGWEVLAWQVLWALARRQWLLECPTAVDKLVILMAFGANCISEVIFGRFAFSGYTRCELWCFHPCCLVDYWHIWEEAEGYPFVPKKMKGSTKLRKLSWLPLGRWVLFQCCHLISVVNRSGMSGDSTRDLAWSKHHVGRFHDQIWHDLVLLGLL